METCQVCAENIAVCTVSVFIPGRDEQGVHNTAEISRLCSDCTVKLIQGDLRLTSPQIALILADMLR